jgi:hypothetical protein
MLDTNRLQHLDKCCSVGNTVLLTLPHLGYGAIHGNPNQLAFRKLSGMCDWRAFLILF